MEPTLKLRGVSPELTESSGNVNTDIYNRCVSLLEAQGYFVCEDVIERAGHLRNRKLVQWKAILKAVEQLKESPLLSFSCKDMRDLASTEFDRPLIRVRKEILEKLAKHNGHEVAGYGLPQWGERSYVKQRAINTRRSISTGFENSAHRIETAIPPVLAGSDLITQESGDGGVCEEAVAGLCGTGPADRGDDA